jgi:hypothetical protein
MTTLRINHEVRQTKSGVVLVRAKHPVTEQVVAVYDDGSVRTKSGDVWAAKKIGDSYVTVQ